MYTDHFGLNEKPFSISPDPRYLYLSHRHADALAHLLYGVTQSGGFIQLTGEVGTGKTTLIRSLLGQLPEKTEIALILNPQLSTKQFLQAICQELCVPVGPRDTARALVDRLNARLLELHAAGKRAVLIVDEAQAMSPELLEQVRLLTNLETERQKLLQIILIGQPELREVLGREHMRQIAQRITGRFHLEPLTAADTAVYVRHRMKVAGGRPDIFSKRAVQRLFRLSRGIPRLINVIADRALLAAYTRDRHRIDARLVRQAATEVFGGHRGARRWPWAAAASVLVLLLWLTTTPDLDDSAPIRLAMVDTSAPPPATDAAVPRGAARATSQASQEPAFDAVATPGLDELLTADDDPDAATATLFSLWDAEFAPDRGPACDQAAAAGLRCFVLNGGSISELRRINRPVRMELIAADGMRHHLVLTGLGTADASVVVAGQRQRIGLSDLTRYAYGEHLVLWRPAVAGAAGPLALGASGIGVIWLRTTLESLGRSGLASETPGLFDAGLAAAVRDYQRDRGLTADGIVGDRTLITLQSEIGLVGVPLNHAIP